GRRPRRMPAESCPGPSLRRCSGCCLPPRPAARSGRRRRTGRRAPGTAVPSPCWKWATSCEQLPAPGFVVGRAEQLADGAAQLGLLRLRRRIEAEGAAEDDQRYLAFFRQQTVVAAVGVHA